MARHTRRQKSQYTPPTKYTSEELREMLVADLLADAENSERQAAEGPFYPERGITRESLLAYAAECRRKARGQA